MLANAWLYYDREMVVVVMYLAWPHVTMENEAKSKVESVFMTLVFNS